MTPTRAIRRHEPCDAEPWSIPIAERCSSAREAGANLPPANRIDARWASDFPDPSQDLSELMGESGRLELSES